MIDLKTLKQLVKLMQDNDLTDLEVEGGDEHVKLRRRSGSPEVQYVTAPQHAAPAQHAAPPPAPAQPAAAAPAAPQDTGAAITSPMVGTYYSAPSPDAKDFVTVGDRVTPDTVVCIIEAMKVFNEIKAEASGTITKVLVTNGASVEFGQPLFQIKPD